ncbi:MAG: ParA family protein [Ralstonia sp.]|uniref:ParA family protein n=1 Tax=Ralstonia sp. TaxID=54061 RepID=UPI003F7CF2F3
MMFDDIVPTIGVALGEFFGDQRPTMHLIRDVSGSVTLVVPDGTLDQPGLNKLARILDEQLGRYSPGLNRVLLEERDLIDPLDVLDSPDRIPSGIANVYLVDRLLTNQDWLRKPIAAKPPLPTLAAFSIKGGVGRSTALAMLAWYFAKEGKRVTVVDLDLEAPGIGSMLLSDLPEYGLIDWMMESLSGSADSALLDKCIGQSPVAIEETGSIDVVPAYGALTMNYVSKLGRVYMPTVDNDGAVRGLAERLFDLLSTLSKLNNKPDVVLLDARAGLHDIGSAVVTRLGAEALLFGRNEKQSWWAYEQLFRHLSSASSVTQGMGSDEDLRWRLKMVAAQTEPQENARRAWVQASYEVWESFYDDESAGGEPDFEPQVFDRFSAEAPHFPIFVTFDPTVRSLVLTDLEARPDWNFVNAVFGDFFKGAEARLWPGGGSSEVGSEA